LKSKDHFLLEQAYNLVQAKEIEREADRHDRKQIYKDQGVYNQKQVIEFFNRCESGYDSIVQEVLGSDRWERLLNQTIKELRYFDLTNEQRDAIYVFYKDGDYESWFEQEIGRAHV